jgi:hypothetical protein
MGTILLAGLTGLAVIVAGNLPVGPSGTPLEVVAAAVPDPSTEATVAPAALTAAAKVTSGDGLRLDLTSTGAIASVRSGSRTLPRLSTTLPGGFSMRKVGGTANLVRNGGFESGKTYWTISGTPAPALATTSRTGTRSLKVSRSTIGDTGSFSQKVAVSPNTNYFAGAWIKTSSVKPSSTGVGNLASTNAQDSPVQIRVDQLNSAGTILSTHWIVGYTDTSGWAKHSVGFRTASSAATVKLTGRLKGGQGTAWFDDIWVKPLFAASESRIGGTIKQVDSATVDQAASVNGLAFSARYKRASNHIRVSGSLTGTSDKAFRLTFSLPVNAVGWRWGDHLRKSRTIASGVTYGQDFSGMIETSRYPFAAVNDGSSGLAVATKLSQPSLSRFRYDSRAGLTVSFDLGVSPAAAGGKTTFNFVLYPFAPSWGMRQAAADFYALEAASFTRRTAAAREGGWYLGDLDPSHPNLDDADWPKWGLGLHRGHRGGEGSYPWDAARDIYRATYTHHWGYFMPPPAGDMLSYDELMARLQSDSAGSGFQGDAARATLESGLRDQNGRLRYDLSVWGIRWYENAAVDPDDYDWAETVQLHQVQASLDAAAAAGAPLDALYMDSASGMRTWGLATDYAREHWGLATRPLTFSYDTGQVTLVNFFQMYEQLKRMAAFLHERGMINAVDYNGDEASPAGYFGADQIDFFAIENGLPERFPASGSGITQDSFALQKRTMAYQKPISILDPKIAAAAANGDLNATELLDVRRRLEQNLFYGFYSGPNKEAADPWWSSMELRDLYAKYSPIARAINGAGWQPVTRATSSDSRVWLERFGKNLGTGSPIYITLRNTTGSSLKPTITVSLGSNQSSVRLRELVAPSSTTTRTVNGASLTYAITVPAGTTRVLRITMP